ncbi:hypothetical protein N5P18_01275 [Janibacter terrae]|uniref:Uncharacterized protein n=1 Tax=Janibacter terrae TaxID=103817 RepID=A0ABZ2FH14_9MICO|nr:hypothetical protein [Janibacter terrae]
MPHPAPPPSHHRHPTHVVPDRTHPHVRGADMSDDAAEARRALQESLDRRDSGE